MRTVGGVRRLLVEVVTFAGVLATGSTTIAEQLLPPVPNEAPAIVLTAPMQGATFTAPATIPVNVTASDTDGTVASVEFYVGMILIASDTSSPYSVTWSDAPAGTYWVTARARDNAGAITTSASRSVTVTRGLPAGWAAGDIGGPFVAGSTHYAGGTGTYTLKGSGEIGSTADRFHFAYRQITGDLDIRARIMSVENIQPWSKAGVMIRETLSADAVNGLMFISGTSGSAFHQRATNGAVGQAMEGTAVAPPYWVRLERRGSQVTGSQSPDGVTWTTIGTMTLSQPAVYVGLAVASADANQLGTGEFDNVAVTVRVANQLPAVSLTAPANGATFTAPATMSVSATASDTDGTIATVEFYAGSTLIGSDTISPYSVTWNNVAPGNYSLTAVARDDAGATTTSTTRSITVTAPVNQPPAVSLTAPASGATFTAPATITISATASDTDGTVASVEFYAGMILIASDTSSPYSVTWSGAPAGTYWVTARARDNAGAITTSASRSITVTGGLPAGWTASDIGGPSVTGSTQYAGGTGTYTLKGSGEIGSTADRFHFAYRQITGDLDIRARIMSVENIQPWSKAGVMIRETLNADAVNGLMFISGTSGSAFHQRATTGAVRQATEGTAVAPPYWVRLERRGSQVTGSQSPDGVTWTTIGTMTLSQPTVYVGLAVASSDNTQLTTGVVDNVAVTVPVANQLPAVSLTAPANGATFPAPATVSVSATASDTDGTIATVEFYAGTTLIGTDNTSPYSVTWSNVPAGGYQVTAVARDNDGGATTSAARSVTVSAGNQVPNVSLTSPANGATFTAPATITISATASDVDGTITVVEFYRGGTTLIGSDTTSPYGVTWSSAPAGSYQLTAVARDNTSGMTVSSATTITVNDAGAPSHAVFSASADHDSNVDYYVVDVFPQGANPNTANPVATQNIGKPPVVGGECDADVRAMIQTLSPGSYIATVTAFNSDGSARSTASAPFTR